LAIWEEIDSFAIFTTLIYLFLPILKGIKWFQCKSELAGIICADSKIVWCLKLSSQVIERAVSNDDNQNRTHFEFAQIRPASIDF